MNYYSTSGKFGPVDLRTAVLHGLAPDGGLFMPERIPLLPRGFVSRLHERSLVEIAFEVAALYSYGEIKAADLQSLVENAITFDAPLARLNDRVFALELFHGPTLAFKDFGARFMARMLSYFVRNDDRETVVLVATSGDTGTAVAHGFLGAEGIKVVILYPSGKVSPTQEAQLTTCGSNITAVEVEGTFDDCQRLVKQAFCDAELAKLRTLTSANSINIARLIPQTFYYFYAGAQLGPEPRQLVFSVPSGNFGNLTAGLMAKRMGLPAQRFVAATNSNDVVPQYLASGVFRPRPSVQTISNAMDVGNPSNFERIISLYNRNIEALLEDLSGCSFSDRQTAQAILKVHDEFGYLMDPHGAVGYLGLESARTPTQTGIFLECAHPGKFHETVSEIIGREIELPEALTEALAKPKQSVLVPTDYFRVRDVILERTQ